MDFQNAPELNLWNTNFPENRTLGTRAFTDAQHKPTGRRADIAQINKFQCGAQVQQEAGIGDLTGCWVTDQVDTQHHAAPQGDQGVRIAVAVIVRGKSSAMQLGKAFDNELDRSRLVDNTETLGLSQIFAAGGVFPASGDKVYFHKAFFETARIFVSKGVAFHQLDNTGQKNVTTRTAKSEFEIVGIFGIAVQDGGHV